MQSPFTGGPATEITTVETYHLRGQAFEVAAPCYRCEDTGEHFTTDAQDELFLAEAQRQWRERNQVPTPQQLQARRKSLHLLGTEMSALLGFGTNQYRQYEKGEFPSESNARLLKLVMDPRALLPLLDAATPAIEAKVCAKVRGQLLKSANPTLYKVVQRSYQRGASLPASEDAPATDLSTFAVNTARAASMEVDRTDVA